MGALVAMARQVIGMLPTVGSGVGRAIRSPFGVGAGVGTLAGNLGLPDFGFGGGGGGQRRRRRRKMFTDTDLAQFAAAEGIAGKKAAATLMMIRAAKE